MYSLYHSYTKKSWQYLNSESSTHIDSTCYLLYQIKKSSTSLTIKTTLTNTAYNDLCRQEPSYTSNLKTNNHKLNMSSMSSLPFCCTWNHVWAENVEAG